MWQIQGVILKFIENIKEALKKLNEQRNIPCLHVGGLSAQKILIFPNVSVNSMQSNKNPNSIFLET